MFDLGMQELIVIFIVALLVFGPKKLPELGRTLGKAIGELKSSLQGAKERMDAEIKDIKDPLKLDVSLDVPKWDDKKEHAPSGSESAQGKGDSSPAQQSQEPQQTQETQQQTKKEDVKG
jgi:TatA/E family protein of Tat protein translocase